MNHIILNMYDREHKVFFICEQTYEVLFFSFRSGGLISIPTMKSRPKAKRNSVGFLFCLDDLDGAKENGLSSHNVLHYVKLSNVLFYVSDTGLFIVMTFVTWKCWGVAWNLGFLEFSASRCVVVQLMSINYLCDIPGI